MTLKVVDSFLKQDCQWNKNGLSCLTYICVISSGFLLIFSVLVNLCNFKPVIACSIGRLISRQSQLSQKPAEIFLSNLSKTR